MSVVIQDDELKPKKALTKRQVTRKIILHCSATPDGRDVSVQQIDRDHKDNRGWNMIAYNYVVYRDGSVHVGRPEWAVGGHTSGHNSDSIGVCYIGGMDKSYKNAKDTRTDEQTFALIELVHYLLDKYNLTLADVHCHNEYAAKACPSFSIETFRREYEEYYR